MAGFETDNVYSRLEKILLNLPNPSVLVVGDLMLDEYIYGITERVSPEAPVGIVEWQAQGCSLGGAANVANNLVHLGCEAFLTGVVGNDEKGVAVRQLAQQAGIHVDGVFIDPTRSTTVKTRVVTHGQQVLRLDKEDRRTLDEDTASRLLSYAEKIAPHLDGVILSDYGKGVLGPTLCQGLIRLRETHGLPVIVDPKGKDFSKYRSADVITPNRKEVEGCVHFELRTEEDLSRAAQMLLGATQCRAILVTRGREGMSLFCADGRVFHIRNESREVFDVTGAGDTAIAMFGRVLFCGYEMADAARLANIAGGIKVGKLGTAVVTAMEVLRYTQDREVQARIKVVDSNHLADLVNRARLQNKKLVFTNGCFDLLHMGHIRFLQFAKSLGDLLIVAINDDDSVRRLKGTGRPLIGQYERANILAALEAVDYVTIFPEPGPLNLILKLRPDILIKGGNYGLDQVVGREEVESYGGHVRLAPHFGDESTSDIVRKIALSYGNLHGTNSL